MIPNISSENVSLCLWTAGLEKEQESNEQSELRLPTSKIIVILYIKFRRLLIVMIGIKYMMFYQIYVP